MVWTSEIDGVPRSRCPNSADPTRRDPRNPIQVAPVDIFLAVGPAEQAGAVLGALGQVATTTG
ncbi:hypothetical protein TEK04_17890 [Klenkia sp. LSe6-5]|uniref:Uncharacterized protein n=1 Tax=Klenkia sesuvii TaxID=3103137 RepID=A0ABU8DY79_9ACTN